jgi:hypothetical protein
MFVPVSGEATVTDKDVERNVRSTTVEGIKTPTERHVHGIGEKHAISFGEKSEAKKTRESLLEKFRRRESKLKQPATPAAGEESEPGRDRGGDDSPQ